MSTPRLYSIFEYLATLVAERPADQPFLVNQLQNAITYKFPDFSFAAYELPGLKDFIIAGEKAGYFKLVNTGSFQTAYLQPGTKQPQPIQASSPSREMGANDPRRQRWMTLALENLLTSERADQIMDSIKGLEVQSPEFDAFLQAQIKLTPLYPTRGKIKRLRDFLSELHSKGEAQAAASWQVSRSMLRMPPTPPIDDAGRAQSLIWALLQGSTTIAATPVEQLDNMFFAVLNYSREQVTRNKSWDWAVALDMLEAEARAVPRPVPVQKKAGLFGGKAQLVVTNQLDEQQIAEITEQLRAVAGNAQGDDTATWKAFVQTPNLETSYRFMVEHPKLAEDERLVTWLEGQIGENVASGGVDAVRNLANKAALVIGVHQFGLEGVRQQSAELKNIYESVMAGAKLLSVIFGFIDAPDSSQAGWFFTQHSELADDSIGPLFEDQMRHAAHNGDVARFRQISERMDLWRNLVEFGMEQGMTQHEAYLANHRDDQQIQAEMGFMLLLDATSAEERQDVVSSYPAVATKRGLRLAEDTLAMLSFHTADNDVYNRHYEVKRLIERCLELGIDRALAELK